MTYPLSDTFATAPGGGYTTTLGSMTATYNSSQQAIDISAPNAQSILQRRSVVVMSSGANEPVFDEGRDGHSPFAYHLMGTLSQVKDWQVGGNVFERVRFAVAKSLPQRPQYSAAPSAGHQPGGDYLFEARELETAR